MEVTVRSVEWRSSHCRPKAMASVFCPTVKSWETGEKMSAWMGMIHCNACDNAREIHLNYSGKVGEVHCAAK